MENNNNKQIEIVDKKEVIHQLEIIISDYHNFTSSFTPLGLKVLAEKCIALIEKKY